MKLSIDWLFFWSLTTSSFDNDVFLMSSPDLWCAQFTLSLYDSHLYSVLQNPRHCFPALYSTSPHPPAIKFTSAESVTLFMAELLPLSCSDTQQKSCFYSPLHTHTLSSDKSIPLAEMLLQRKCIMSFTLMLTAPSFRMRFMWRCSKPWKRINIHPFPASIFIWFNLNENLKYRKLTKKMGYKKHFSKYQSTFWSLLYFGVLKSLRW